MGYLGGGVLFAIDVYMTLNPEIFGFKNSTEAVKFSFLTVSVWWFVFSLPLFINVPEVKIKKNDVVIESLCKSNSYNNHSVAFFVETKES